jgi:hypothetical protein
MSNSPFKNTTNIPGIGETNPAGYTYFQAPFTTFRNLGLSNQFPVSGGGSNPYFMPGSYNSNLFNSASEALKNDMFNVTNTGGTVSGGFGVDLTAGTDAATAASGGFNFKNMTAAQQMQMASGIGGIIQGLVGRRKRRARQRAAKREYEKQRELYSQLDTSNLAAGFRNNFQNMENTYEDMTVNQQQALFMAQQNQQSQANTMEALRGAAGSSGIAGLAQIIANQSQLAAQKASASIGLQEAQNQKLAAQGAAQNQMMERKGEFQAQVQRLQGARESRMLDYQKQEMELGFAMQEKAAADQAVQAANAALYGGIGTLATQAVTGGFGG